MSVKPEFTATWHDWVITNLRRDCTVESIVGAMVGDGFDLPFAEAVVAVLKSAPNGLGALRNGAGATHNRNEANQTPSTMLGRGMGNYTYESSRVPPGNVIATGDRPVRVLARLERPEVVLFGDLLSDDECDELIRLSKPKLARSSGIDVTTGEIVVIDRRTSSGAFFQREENEFLARLDRRLTEVIGWPFDHGEGLQVLNYQVGAEYRPHFDYFPPEEPGSARHTREGGQRAGTVVLYLNDVEDGGETTFPEIGLSVVPRRGNAVYFGYCNSRNELDRLTLHGGAPVRRGEKWIATKWLRKEKWRSG